MHRQKKGARHGQKRKRRKERKEAKGRKEKGKQDGGLLLNPIYQYRVRVRAHARGGESPESIFVKLKQLLNVINERMLPIVGWSDLGKNVGDVKTLPNHHH